ncbi:hypothetical protein CRV24_003161 [Beauveria bassiana]|nr:hypothetical protein CRV24_003161 [Beauveria bassiana]
MSGKKAKEAKAELQEAGHAVARARDEAKDLRRRVGKVEELRDEQEAERLGEVAEDADDGKDHAGKVAVGVADEDARGVPVVAEEGGGDADPGQEEVEREEVRVGGGVRIGRREVEGVVEGEEEGDDEALGDLNAVDAGEHVDALRAKHGDAGHVDVVQRAEVEELAEVGLQLHGYDDARHVKVDKVDDEDGDGGQAGDPPLVPPANVEEVVADSEESNSLQGNDGAQIGSKLGVKHVREAALVDVLGLEDNIAVAAAARGRDNVLVKGKRYEDDDGEEVDGGADGAHALGQLGPAGLGEVAAAEAGADKRGPEPADHGVAERKGGKGEGERRDERLAVAGECVGQHGEGGARDGEQSQRLAAR